MFLFNPNISRNAVRHDYFLQIWLFRRYIMMDNSFTRTFIIGGSVLSYLLKSSLD